MSVSNIAITMLQSDRPVDWDGIMLDYDLDEPSYADIPYKCGMDVAYAIVHEMDRDIPILVHSMNPAGSERVRKLLEADGFAHGQQMPFGYLTRKHFSDWLSLCCDVVSDRRKSLGSR